MVDLVWNSETEAENSHRPSAAAEAQSPTAADDLEIKCLQIAQVHDVRGSALDTADQQLSSSLDAEAKPTLEEFPFFRIQFGPRLRRRWRRWWWRVRFIPNRYDDTAEAFVFHSIHVTCIHGRAFPFSH